MSSQGYDDLGPRIDLGHEEPAAEREGYRGGQAPAAYRPARGPGGGGGGGAGRGVAWISLLVAAVALVLAGWAWFSAPQQVAGPPMSPDVVPGGAAERVAKLEKDVSQLMLRLVTLEKELQSLANKAGTVNQLTELTSKVAALQDRIEALSVDSRVASLDKRRNQSEPAAQAPQPEPQKKAAPAKPERKKLTYTVRRGDTLFTVAQRYKVRMKDLMAWNDIKRGDILRIGEKLVIYK
jgi:LysM repeat protein